MILPLFTRKEQVKISGELKYKSTYALTSVKLPRSINLSLNCTMTCYMLKPSIFLSSKFHLYKTQSPSWAVKTQLAKELSICSIVIVFVHFAILEREINTKLLPITSKSKSLNRNFKKRKKRVPILGNQRSNWYFALSPNRILPARV